MSLRSLSKQIHWRSQEMDKQRHCTTSLLQQQKNDVENQAQRVPLPVAIGLAFVGGFLAQRLLHNPAPRTLLRYYFTWRTLL